MASFDIAGLTQNLHAARREWREAHGRTQEPGRASFLARRAG
jgi:serine O-acetyltransferase